MRAWKLAALAALILGMLPLPARAGEVSESITNKNISGPPGYVWDGSRWRRQTGDATGVTKTTEAYPDVLQAGNDPMLASAVALTTGWKVLGNSASVTPYGYKALVISLATSAAADKSYYYLEASDDNVTFYPVYQSGIWNATLAAADTMMTQVTGATAAVNLVLPLPTDTYMGRYLRVVGARDSTAGSARNITGIRLWGRWR